MPLSVEEPLARFIVDKNYFRADRSVRHSAFMPSHKDGKVSVFRIFDLDLDGIWDLGNRNVAIPRGKRLLGRADIKVSDVTAVDLAVVPDDDPPLHASITGWPEDGSKQKLLALQLAAKAILHLISDRPR
jgi:hypothetical protein